MNRAGENIAGRRDKAVDLCKGMGILCVIAGHSSVSPAIKLIIYMFHMPLFFWIGGYLDKCSYPSVKDLFVRKGSRLLYPYVLFGSLIIIYNTAKDTLLGSFEGIRLLKRIIALVYGNYIWENNYDYIGTLWFLPALFWAAVLFNLIKMICGKINCNIYIMAFLVSAVGVILSLVERIYAFRVLFCFEIGCVAVIFYAFGFFWRQTEAGAAKPGKGILLIIAGLLAGMVNSVYMKVAGSSVLRIDMLYLNYGFVPLFIVSALCITVGIYMICRGICGSKFTAYAAHLGENSLIIMITHLYVIQITDMFFHHFDIRQPVLLLSAEIALPCLVSEMIAAFNLFWRKSAFKY